MKNQYKFLLSFLVLLNLYRPFSLNAQLTGSYTIGVSPSSDYNSFSAAIYDLNEVGVDGNVEFHIHEGIYNEHFTLENIIRTNEYDKITFKAQDPNNEPIVKVSDFFNIGIKDQYVFFNNIKFEQSSSDFWNTLPLISITDGGNPEFNNCDFKTNSTNDNIQISGPSGVFARYCTFENGNYAIRTFGLSDPNWDLNYKYFNIKGSSFVNQRLGAVFSNFPQLIQLKENLIETSKANGNFVGVKSENSTNYVLLYRNKIVSNNGIGVVVSNIQTPQGLVLDNNMISTSSNCLSIKDVNNLRIEFNSLYSSSFSPVVKLEGVWSNDSLEPNYFSNNILYNSGFGTAYEIIGSTNNLVSDYNDFYTNGQNLFKWQGKIISSLFIWKLKTGGDYNSMNEDPLFNSTNDLHLQLNTGLLGKGFNYAGHLLFDFDLEERSGTFPTIGADEPSHTERFQRKKTEQLSETGGSVVIFPNPAINYLKVNFFLEKEGVVSVKVFDLGGNLILEKPEQIIEKGNFELTIDQFPKKINTNFLIVQVIINNKVYIKKIQLKR